MFDSRAFMSGYYENRIRDFHFVFVCFDEIHVVFIGRLGREACAMSPAGTHDLAIITIDCK
ncbi:MAG: hypothetical protein A4E36_01572 [Methanoregulaceae archaeon PtaB.Bin009]|nr:MAG: hypothetical protein A4E36_01572 [Methanoregulaceae archaeon PtaB.Bin009]OPY41023.1 MAG: hypothetical protein A4E41_01096 [Methanoregulaceae archaeon PtaU1.Bin066]